MSKSDDKFLIDLYKMVKPKGTQEGFDAFMGRVNNFMDEKTGKMENDFGVSKEEHAELHRSQKSGVLNAAEENAALASGCAQEHIDNKEACIKHKITSLPDMSLRDYFAGQALAGALANEVASPFGEPKAIPEQCYKFADAMIKERDK